MKGIANYTLRTRDDREYPLSAEGVARILAVIAVNGVFKIGRGNIFPSSMFRGITRATYLGEIKLLIEAGLIDERKHLSAEDQQFKHDQYAKDLDFETFMEG